MKKLLFALAVLCPLSPVWADTYDYGMNYASEAAAKADAALLAGHFDLTKGWLRDHVLAGLKCWRPSLDTIAAGTDPNDGHAIMVRTHNYLAGYYVLASITSAAPIQALLNDTHLAFALNRTARESGAGSFVTKNNIGAVLADLGCEPMFASPRPYPIGGMQ